MSKIWPTVTRENPCPICHKPDWCCVGDFSVVCMRVESSKPRPSGGGWYHPLKESATPYVKPEKKESAPAIDAQGILDECSFNTTMHSLTAFALSLGVTYDSLDSIGCAWSRKHAAWAFAMRSADGSVIGIRLRSLDGKKWAVPGSRMGIFIPINQSPDKLAFVCEGPTDLAAIASMGFFGVGKPQCNAGDQLVVDYLKSRKISKAVIVGDNDTRELNHKEVSPGIEGARALKKALRIPSVIWLPPTKDVRAFYNRGGTRQMIESDLKNLVWKQGL